MKAKDNFCSHNLIFKINALHQKYLKQNSLIFNIKFLYSL